jgi:hypothetical protein
MSDTPIGDATQRASVTTLPTSLDLPRTELAIPEPAELAQLLGARVLPVKKWIGALVEQERFEETDEEAAALSIVRAILLADTPESMFAAMNTQSVDDLLGKEPGARSNVFEIRSATPLASTFDEGPSVFAVISARDMAEGVDVTLSCGARAVQTAILAAQLRGWLPLKAAFERKRKPTRAGYYPINLVAGI